jgi:hypothetical protein
VSEDIRRDPTTDPDPTTRPVDEREAVRDRDAVQGETVHGRDAVQGEAVRDRDAVQGEAVRDRDAVQGEAVRDRDVSEGGQIPRDPTSERVEPEPSEARATTGPGASTPWSAHGGLLPDDELSGYQRRWDELQVRFIDEPRQSVREADDLVGEVTRKIADRFSSGRKDFEQRWEGGDEPTTEELRQAVQRYRDFFQRLVTH